MTNTENFDDGLTRVAQDSEFKLLNKEQELREEIIESYNIFNKYKGMTKHQKDILVNFIRKESRKEALKEKGLIEIKNILKVIDLCKLIVAEYDLKKLQEKKQ